MGEGEGRGGERELIKEEVGSMCTYGCVGVTVCDFDGGL